MKTRNHNIESETVASGGCCGPSTEVAANEPCCAQPTDGSACCDKSLPKEVISNTTGCC